MDWVVTYRADGTVVPNPEILKNNRRMVGGLQYRGPYVPPPPGEEKRQIDVGVLSFLRLCGFDDAEHFNITANGDDFDIFGCTCYSEPPWIMVESFQKKDLILISLDKSVQETSQAIPSNGHLGQIVAEMLQMLSLNRAKKRHRHVFAIRYVNSHVCVFRLDPSEQQLKTLIETRTVPDKKLELLCTHKDPVNCHGWSLIDKEERGKALQVMANIREFLL